MISLLVGTPHSTRSTGARFPGPHRAVRLLVVSTSDRFLAAALAFDREGSPSQAELARGIAGDPAVLAVVDRAEEARRQPVLVLAVCRWLGAPHGSWSVLRPWLLARSDDVVAELGRRLTQTNDVRRCAPLSIALDRVPGPIARAVAVPVERPRRGRCLGRPLPRSRPVRLPLGRSDLG
jgi:hypothetical protein